MKELFAVPLVVVAVLGAIGTWLGWLCMLAAGVISILILSGVAVTGGWTLVVTLACILPVSLAVAFLAGLGSAMLLN